MHPVNLLLGDRLLRVEEVEQTGGEHPARDPVMLSPSLPSPLSGPTERPSTGLKRPTCAPCIEKRTLTWRTRPKSGAASVPATRALVTLFLDPTPAGFFIDSSSGELLGIVPVLPGGASAQLIVNTTLFAAYPGAARATVTPLIFQFLPNDTTVAT